MIPSLPPAPWSSQDQAFRNGEAFYVIQTPAGAIDLQIPESMAEIAPQIVKAITALPELLAALQAFHTACETAPPINLLAEISKANRLAEAAITKAGFTP